MYSEVGTVKFNETVGKFFSKYIESQQNYKKLKQVDHKTTKIE